MHRDGSTPQETGKPLQGTPSDAAVEAVLAGLAEDLDRRLGRAVGLRGVVSAHLQAVARQEALYVQILELRPRLSQRVRERLQSIDGMVSEHLDRALSSGCAGCTARVSPRFAYQVWIALVHHRLTMATCRTPSPVFALAR